MKLSRSLGLSLTIALLITLLAYFIFIEPTIHEQAVNGYVKELYQELNDTDLFLSEFISNMSSDLEYILQYDLLRQENVDYTSYLSAVESGFTFAPSQEELEIMAYFNVFKSAKPYLENIYIGNEQGQFVMNQPLIPEDATSDQLFNYDPRSRIWYQLAQDKPEEFIVTDIYPGTQDENIFLTIAKSLTGDDEAHIGVVGFDINIAQLANFLRSTRNNKPGILGIMQEDTVIVVDEDQNVSLIKQDPDLSREMAALSGAESAYRLIKHEDQWYYMMLEESKVLEWTYYILIPKAYMLNALREQMVVFGMLILLLASTLVTSLFIIFHKTVVDPINTLTDTTSKIVSTNDASLRIQNTSMYGLAPLGNLFNTMINQLQHQHNRMQDIIDEGTIELNQLKVAVEQSPSGIVITEQNGKIFYVNQKLLDTYGYEMNEIIGHTPRIFNSGTHDFLFFENLWSTIESGKVWNGNICNKKKDGTLIWESVLIAPVKDKVGSILNFIAIRNDITEQLRILEQKKKSEEKLRFFLEAIGAFYWTNNLKKGDLVYSSNLFFEQYGYKEDEIPSLFEDFSNFFHLEDYEPSIEKRLSGETDKFEIEHRFRTKQGDYVWILDIGKVIEFDSDNNPLVMAGISMDISNRKEQELEISRSEMMLKALFKAIPVGVNLISKEGQILEANTISEELLGISADEVKERELSLKGWIIIDNEGNPMPVEDYPASRALAGEGVVKDVEMGVVKEGGEVTWIITSAAAISDEVGGGVATAFMDVTQKKHAQEKLLEAIEIAESATKAKSDFLANMSHEIRTPMNAIIGLGALLSNTELTMKQSDYIEKINSSAKNLLGIINDILDFSKIEAGKLDIEKIRFNIDEVIGNISNMTSIKAFRKGIEIAIIKDKDVPLWLIGDPLRLNQILINLCNNAVKFTDRGEVLVRIEVVTKTTTEAKIRFTVKDTGIGMTEEQLSMLFKAFTQADTSITRKYGGTGLGLTISKNLIQMMKGEIHVASEAGEGTTFVFELPFGYDPLISEREKRIPAILDELKIVILEDNEAAIEVYEMYLDKMKNKPLFFSSGEAFIEAEIKGLDLVIMDYQLPGMNGIDTWRTYVDDLKVRPLPKILMVTAYGKEVIIAEAERNGIQNILMKPLTQSDLYDAVINATTEKEKLEESREMSLDETMRKLIGNRILLVEDNQINQQVVIENLEPYGLIIHVADNGEEAVAAVKNTVESFDLVLMDLQMPVMDGYKATQAIREMRTSEELPIIALSADVMKDTLLQIDKVGMQAHVGKPINLAGLFETMKQFLVEKEEDQLPTPQRSEVIFDLVNRLPTFEVESALERLMGNQKSYLKLLQSFIEQYGNLDQVIKTLEENDDLEEVVRMFHTLKGLSGSLGLESMVQITKDIEQKLMNGELNIKSLRDDVLILDLREILEHATEEANRMLTSLETISSSGREQTKLLSDDEIASYLKDLLETLETYSTDAENILLDLENEFISRGFKLEFKAIYELVVAYDYEGALELLTELMKQI